MYPLRLATILSILFAVSLMLVIISNAPFLLFLTPLFWSLLDSSFRPELRASGIVKRKHYKPKSEYTTPIQCVSHGEHHHTHTTYIWQETPARYQLLIKIAAGYDWICVKPRFYNSVSVGDGVSVTYCVGRFSNQIYLKNIWK